MRVQIVDHDSAIFTNSLRNSRENPEAFFLNGFHNMGDDEKFLWNMTEPNSRETQTVERIRPQDIMDELNIKKDKYYRALKKLSITAKKDSEQKAYLTQEQANRIRGYLSGNSNEVENQTSASSSLVKADDRTLGTSANSNEDIYVEVEDPTEQFDLNQLVRSAAELKAQHLAMPDLVKLQLASQMGEEDLPDDLKAKVAAAREAANPKYQPANLAANLLGQWRKQNA